MSFGASNCRSCGARIYWFILESGKYHPVDYGEEINASDCEVGDVLVTESGKVIKINSAENYGSIKGRMSHFATCPDANQWRNKA